MFVEFHAKRKREQFTSLTFLRYWGRPNALKRVKAHAVRREPSTFALCIFFQFPNCQKQESKRTLQRILNICIIM